MSPAHESPRNLYRRAWRLARLMFRNRTNDHAYAAYYWQLQNLRLDSDTGRRIYRQIDSVAYQALGNRS